MDLTQGSPTREHSPMNYAWWIHHIFNQPLAAKSQPDSVKAAAEISPEDALQFMTHLFQNCGSLLTPYSNHQVAEGLFFLTASGESDWIYHLYNPSLDLQLRTACIRSIETLYQDCFARRCLKQSSHGSADIQSLNATCYMLWERIPCGRIGEKDDPAIHAELIDLMTRALQIEHIACQESALHGLGHWYWAPGGEHRVPAIIANWLTTHPHLPTTLRQYAQAAKCSNVQ